MKARWLLLLSCLAVALLRGESGTRPPQLLLKSLPELNEILSNLPASNTGELVNSGTIARRSYEVVADGVIWRVSVADSNRVLMVSTSDPHFKTAEGISVTSDIATIIKQYPNSLGKEMGWGEWVDLPSGFSAYIRGPNEVPVTDAKIKSLFKRCR